MTANMHQVGSGQLVWCKMPKMQTPPWLSCCPAAKCNKKPRHISQNSPWLSALLSLTWHFGSGWALRNSAKWLHCWPLTWLQNSGWIQWLQGNGWWTEKQSFSVEEIDDFFFFLEEWRYRFDAKFVPSVVSLSSTMLAPSACIPTPTSLYLGVQFALAFLF